MRTVAFFNNKGGVGKTTLVYHLAWMFAELGETVLAVDLDPQANLTSMFLEETDLEDLWPNGEHPNTIFGALRPIIRGIGDVLSPHVQEISPRIGLVVGDLALSTFEDKLSDAWPRCHNADEAAFRTMTAFHRAVGQAARKIEADWMLFDIGPNLGAINRAALIASESVVLPVAPDLFSLQGLRNLGPTLRGWRKSWAELRTKNPDRSLDMPAGNIAPAGYVVMQHGIHDRRPPKAYQHWIARFPGVYREAVLDQAECTPPATEDDPLCLGLLKHYRSLMPMAIEAHKPVFALRPADGAIGSHGQNVLTAYQEFKQLALKLKERIVQESDKATPSYTNVE